MALVSCWECEAEISSSASACPKCGAPAKPVGAAPEVPQSEDGLPTPAPAPVEAPTSVVPEPAASAERPAVETGAAEGGALTRRQKLNEVAWVLLVLVAYWAIYGDPGPNPQYAGLMFLQVIGCYYVGKHRNRSGWWGLAGVIPVFCLGLPFFLSIRSDVERRRKTVALRALGGLGLIVLAFVVISWSVVQRGRAEALPARSAEWSMRTLVGLRLLSPFELTPISQDLESLPPNVREMLEELTASSGQNRAGNFAMTVMRRTLRPDYTPILEGYLEEVFKERAAHLGGTSTPSMAINPAQVSGNDARRGVCTVTTGGRTFHLDGLVTARGQATWLVFVIYEGDAAATDSRRIMASVQVVEPATTR